MTSIQFFYNRNFPGNALRSNALQALDRLGMKPGDAGNGSRAGAGRRSASRPRH